MSNPEIEDAVSVPETAVAVDAVGVTFSVVVTGDIAPEVSSSPFDSVMEEVEVSVFVPAANSAPITSVINPEAEVVPASVAVPKEVGVIPPGSEENITGPSVPLAEAAVVPITGFPSSAVSAIMPPVDVEPKKAPDDVVLVSPVPSSSSSSTLSS
jgi:hypothetical protein